VSTDSRAVRAGELYVALSGENHDGHAYLAQALANGAAAALVSDASRVPAGLPSIVATDTRRALGELARFHRLRWGGPLVAITGSAGKTTTKELTAAALSGLGQRVLATRGNLNNDVGLPMTLLELSAAHDVAVVEIGTSGPGEIAWLAHVAAPQLGVVTTVALAHAERLPTLDAVADEKCALLRALPADGAAIYSLDSEPLSARRESFSAERVLSFGAGEGADLQLTKRTLGPDMITHCVLGGAAGASLGFDLRLFGLGPALDACAALAVVLALHGAPALRPAAAALTKLEPLPGRMRPCKGRGGSLIIDDSYNANPASMLSSLSALRELATLRQGRAIAALGDMAELGDHSEAEHAGVGRELVRAGVSEALLCGPLMAHAARAARDEVTRLRAKGPHVEHRSNPEACVPELIRLLGPKDTLLVKGSRSMQMERLVDALSLDKGDAA
jgi:UDP-N-acetylmuramoyl-tripeptide--D-alanyl-D-alanine ligase